ncbi:endo-1,4-beta-xylanase [Actinokineospora sp. UTMC 2448]|uniref:endo-1,4-beta-xylanase n=1 Tax=Actinokineospora sp. UTMC 2448 TaxID=2268449 RepID=UPI0021641A7B|nr:endo-1,4-beta-xylanase [Actinokineospora sp. UTMC 2448]UVS76526.1 Exoglucanase/xylanase precursor [Actinokineospora sp. UTMC 2448]
MSFRKFVDKRWAAATGVASVAATAAALLTLAAPGTSAAAAGLGGVAESSGRYVGTAVDPNRYTDGSYGTILDTEFNSVTAENAMKWDALQPSRGQYNWAQADRIMQRAEATGQMVRGHTLVWHSQTPSWVQNLSATELRQVMVDHITTVMTRYKGRIAHWDVVNEAFNDDGSRRQSFWQQKLGDSYIADAFRAARAADPSAKLYINDYSTDAINAKSTAIYNLVRQFKQQGVPIDGVGFQAHLIINQVPGDFRQNLQRFADLGVDVAITELDIRMQTPSDAQKLATQKADYQKSFAACWAVTRCKGVTIWGITDKFSWIPDVFPGQGAALVWNESYQKKPAYDGAVAGMGGTTPTTTTTTTTTDDGPPPGDGCTATYRIVNQWGGGFQAEVRVTADGPISGWAVSWTFTGGERISQIWNATASGTSGAITARNVSYNGNLGAGASTTFGFVGSGTPGTPTATCSAA